MQGSIEGEIVKPGEEEWEMEEGDWDAEKRKCSLGGR